MPSPFGSPTRSRVFRVEEECADGAFWNRGGGRVACPLGAVWPTPDPVRGSAGPKQKFGHASGREAWTAIPRALFEGAKPPTFGGSHPSERPKRTPAPEVGPLASSFSLVWAILDLGAGTGGGGGG